MKQEDSFREVRDSIYADLKKVGINIPEGCELFVKRSHSKFAGAYRIRTGRIFVYAYDGDTPFSYIELMCTAIHECCHAIQWDSFEYIRTRNQMHDKQFWRMNKEYLDKYVEVVHGGVINEYLEAEYEYIKEHSSKATERPDFDWDAYNALLSNLSNYSRSRPV